jgi:hypothetical protein
VAPAATFDVHGLSIRVSGDWAEVIESARLDFAWFETPDGPDREPLVDVRVERSPVSLDGFGSLPASFVTPRYAVFSDAKRTIVDYRGVTAVVMTRRGNAVSVQGEDVESAHEAVYYFLLGRIGRHLDSLELVRVHGLGLAAEGGGAVLVLLPAGGGKSTLALQAVQNPPGRLLSEESPLLDSSGCLHPFPLRIAVGKVPPALRTTVDRSVPNPAVGRKQAVEVRTFADRVEATPQPLRHIVVSTRSLGRASRLEERPRTAALLPLIAHGVVGSGLYQGLGHAHQRGLGELAGKMVVAARRARTCAVGLRQAQVWHLTHGRDLEQGWRTMQTLLT